VFGCVQEEMIGLPLKGRWIQYNWKNARDFNPTQRCKVVDYEDCESFGFNVTGAYQETERQAVLEYPGGDTDSQDESFFKLLNWSYIPEPSTEEIETAVLERNNKLLGYSCKACQSTSTKLLMCKGCRGVRYCDTKCQRSDWPVHAADCAKRKVVRKPNPRYPLDNIQHQIATKQRNLQIKANAALMDALNGRFKIFINERWVQNPKATDLETLDRCMLRHDSDQDNVIHFKQRYLDTSPHANGEPTSCSLYLTLELVFENETKYKEGGLHYLVLDESDPGMFWGMALNFNTFGTVGPFSTKCHCNFPKMPPSYKKMRKQWDKIFSRAKASSLDVQCMFADTPFGCHSFGLEGDAGCKFNHDISVNIDKEN